MSDPTGAQPTDELDDDALEAAAGGVSTCTCPSVCRVHRELI